MSVGEILIDGNEEGLNEQTGEHKAHPYKITVYAQ
jgi:hypothetical protein